MNIKLFEYYYCYILILLAIVQPVLNLTAYDRANLLSPEPIEQGPREGNGQERGYTPRLQVKFLNLKLEKRRRTATIIRDGKILIETKPLPEVKKVEVDERLIQVRFGGGPRVHFPYPRVVSYDTQPNSDTDELEATTSSEPTEPTTPIVPRFWQRRSTTPPAYSAEPALYLPSRFNRNDSNVVIVFKKRVKFT